MRTLLRCLGLLSPRRCPDIPVSADKFLQIIHIFETLDVDHREVEELSSLLAQPVVDASHGLLSPWRCPGIPVSADKFLQMIHIFETPDTDHREVDELSSLLAQPAADAPHDIEQLRSLPFDTGEPLVQDRTGYVQAEGPKTGAHGSEKDAAVSDMP
ncbi:hypothetical protein CRG98_019318 [Punica granatum]|uniref:Uncharacterized protein n=1 Tax=Punica granatum TaxID=22663 RepID=A0A2I0JWN0_PUNGR|nr:hypothetical protein CRG98_019318 [Punica granatum]